MRVFWAIICFLFMSGCASMESLDRFHEEIIWDDGINRNEAAVIAKKWLSESKYEGDFQLFGPVSAKHEGEWQITFLYKSLGYYEKVLDVFVDSQSGEVKKTVIRQRDSPVLNRD